MEAGSLCCRLLLKVFFLNAVTRLRATNLWVGLLLSKCVFRCFGAVPSFPLVWIVFVLLFLCRLVLSLAVWSIEDWVDSRTGPRGDIEWTGRVGSRYWLLSPSMRPQETKDVEHHGDTWQVSWPRRGAVRVRRGRRQVVVWPEDLTVPRATEWIMILMVAGLRWPRALWQELCRYLPLDAKLWSAWSAQGRGIGG